MSNETEWVLVPREPTPEMLEKGGVWNTEMDTPPEHEVLHCIWRDMLAAAPQPPAEAKPDPSFAEWLATEMPAGTVIGDPAWWANRIARQYAKRRSPAEAQAVDQIFAEWLASEMPAGTVIGDPAWWAGRIARQFAKRNLPPSAPVGVEAGWYRYNKPAPRWEDTKFGKWLDPAVYGPPREQHGYSLGVAPLAQQPEAVQKGYKNGLNAALGVIANLGVADSEAQTNGREDAYRAVEALAAQQTAATLPDEDDSDLTVAYMAGLHDGRKEAQQHTTVYDLNAWREAFVEERATRYREGGMAIEQARIHAETDAALMEPTASQKPAAVDDSALLDALAREYWKLDPFDMPTPGGDDADVGWRVIEYHGDEPREREVAVHYADDPRAALRAALAAQQGGA